MIASHRWVVLALIGGCSFQPGSLRSNSTPDVALDTGPAHCVDGWCLRKAIAIAGSEISGSPDEVMLVVRIASDAELAAGAQPSGGDIRFVAADGTLLAYERSRYDAATGALVAWVNVGDLTPIDTTMYLYYGNATAPDQQAGRAAWPTRYAAVWHLDDTNGSTLLDDATTHANTAVATNGAALGGDAVVGTGATLDSINDYLRVAQSTSLEATTGNATFALWINWDSLTSTHYQRVLASENRFGAPDDGYEWSTQPAGDFFLYPWGGAETYNLGPNPFVAGKWHHLVATLDFVATEVQIFVDGVPMVFTTENDATAWTMTGMPGDWLWGCNIGLSGCFGGKLDEIQVMRGARTPGWIRTAHANQRPDSTMLTIGPEQQLPP